MSSVSAMSASSKSPIMQIAKKSVEMSQNKEKNLIIEPIKPKSDQSMHGKGAKIDISA